MPNPIRRCKHRLIEVFTDNMHVQFPRTTGLLLQLVVELMVDAMITQKEWLNQLE